MPPRRVPSSREELLQLNSGDRVLEKDHYGPKVIQMKDGNILKLFRRKKLLSRYTLQAAATRFAGNSRRLKDLGIDAPEVVEILDLPFRDGSAVRYSPIQGETLAQCLKHGRTDRGLALSTGQFINDLHSRGVYFRSLHSGNIIIRDNCPVGLIDVLDMRFFNGYLREGLRLRNWRQFVRRSHIQGGLDQQALTLIAQSYLESCQASRRFTANLNSLTALRN